MVVNLIHPKHNIHHRFYSAIPDSSLVFFYALFWKRKPWQHHGPVYEYSIRLKCKQFIHKQSQLCLSENYIHSIIFQETHTHTHTWSRLFWQESNILVPCSTCNNTLLENPPTLFMWELVYSCSLLMSRHGDMALILNMWSDIHRHTSPLWRLLIRRMEQWKKPETCCILLLVCDEASWRLGIVYPLPVNRLQITVKERQLW